MDFTEIKILKDKKVIENHFRKNTDFNIYAVGDLDDFFFKFTEWFSISGNEGIEQIAYLYSGFEPSTLIALSTSNHDKMTELLTKIKQQLPSKFYAHLNPGLVKIFKSGSILKNFGRHYKMALKDRSRLIKTDDKNIRRLCVNDLSRINFLFEKNYPENFFDKRMLETGKYFGYFENDELAGIAGIHTYSSEYKVAALGNIVTAEQHRKKSICSKLTSALCLDLLETVDNIGLNVDSENFSAIKSYEKSGFEVIGEYEEFLIENF